MVASPPVGDAATCLTGPRGSTVPSGTGCGGDAVARPFRLVTPAEAARSRRLRDAHIEAARYGACLPQDRRPGPEYAPGARVQLGEGLEAMRGTIQQVENRSVHLRLDRPFRGDRRLAINYMQVVLLPAGADDPEPTRPMERQRIAAFRRLVALITEAQEMGATLTDLLSRLEVVPHVGTAEWEAAQRVLVQHCHDEHRQIEQARQAREDLDGRILRYQDVYAEHYARLLELGVAEEVLPPRPVSLGAGHRVRKHTTPSERKRLEAVRRATRQRLVALLVVVGDEGIDINDMIKTLCRTETDDVQVFDDGSGPPLAINENRVLGMLSALCRASEAAPLAGNRWRATPALLASEEARRFAAAVADGAAEGAVEGVDV